MAPFALMSPIVAGTASALGLAVSRSAIHGDSAPAGRNTRDFRCWCPLGVLRSLDVISSLLSGLAGGVPALAHDESPRDAAGARFHGPRPRSRRGVPPSYG
jgi:hypothetical protein